MSQHASEDEIYSAPVQMANAMNVGRIYPAFAPKNKGLKGFFNKPFNKIRKFKRAVAAAVRESAKNPVIPEKPLFGVVGTIWCPELNGLVGAPLRRPDCPRGKLDVRILSDGDHQGEIVQIAKKHFIPIRGRKRRFIAAPPPRGNFRRLQKVTRARRRAMEKKVVVK